MKIFLVSYRVVDGYGIYTVVVVANDHDEAEEKAKLFEPFYEIGSVELIDPSAFKFPGVARSFRYIE